MRLLFGVGSDFVRLALHGKQQLVGRVGLRRGGENQLGVVLAL
jgi:hypothetical protein